MGKYRWNAAAAAAGDDAPDSQKVNWKPDLAPPPREIYALLDRATAAGLWLKWARNGHILACWGARYRLTKAGGTAVVFSSDSLAEIEECLREFDDAP
ncbi:MAG: hypothetical protein WA161_21360 [Pseudomonas sp.]|uniref:hypothetical protein n=1 Tax=Pseudomonas sp. TaxID=306 RepID=UPI003BB813BD